MAHPPDELLTSSLRAIPRSLYPALRVLSPSVRPQVSVAYLLARTADSIADTQSASLDQRLMALRQLRERIEGTGQPPLAFRDLLQNHESTADRVLLENCEETLRRLDAFSPSAINLIREVLTAVISGQELDLSRFADVSPENIRSVQTEAELDDYTYRLAGCVFETWTRLCRADLFPQPFLSDTWLRDQSVRFGKGLHWVAILRDLHADLRQGRCYLPAERLAACALKPADLLRPGNEPRLRPLYNDYLTKADFHLQAGWAYTNALPRGSIRLRLACAWPILIGQETLKRLWTTNVLDRQQRIKISRTRVKHLMFRSVLLYPWQGAWRRMVT
jgi:farnesyl-diphosphate farnesyltransferase